MDRPDETGFSTSGLTICPPPQGVEEQPIEFVERKGRGHPDTLCDGMAEAVSRALSKAYIERTGRILHHNTDKLQLIAGRSEPGFGGGEIHRPIEVVIGGRATATAGGDRIPVHRIAEDAARSYLLDTVDELSGEMVSVESRIGETSADLQALYESGEIPRSNDTSIGVGYAPLSELEWIVLTLEREIRDRFPAAGEDVKVMGYGTDDRVELTVAVAIIDRHVESISAYRDTCHRIREFAISFGEEHTGRPVDVQINAADEPDADAVYVTVTGLSAEMGDDGMVGRGNRANGLITPCRQMSMEAPCGKNPVSHVGKLYNIAARRIAQAVHEDLGSTTASVKLLSRIGSPITNPHATVVETDLRDRPAIEDVVRQQLDGLPDLKEDVLAGNVQLF